MAHLDPSSTQPVGSDVTPVHSTPRPRSGALTSGPVAGAVAALVGGLLAVVLISAIFPLRELPERLQRVTPFSSQELQDERQTAVRADIRLHAIAALATVGALAGMTFAFGEGLASRRVLSGVICALVAIPLGAAAGWLGGIIGWEVRQVLAGSLPPLGVTVIYEVVALGLLGLGVGLSPALVHLRGPVILTGITGGLLGGGLAGLVYPIITTILLTRVNTEVLVPLETSGRLALTIIACGLIGLTTSGLGAKSPKRISSEVEPAESTS